jgi:SAM-dependent methyltransferase
MLIGNALANLSPRARAVMRERVYPVLNVATTLYFRRRYDWKVTPNRVLYGQRGNDYERHRRRVAHFAGGIEGKSVLVFGCGTGKDVPSWLVHEPKRVVGLDYFAYPDDWSKLKAKHAGQRGLDLQFFKQDEGEKVLEPESFDILASDAVLEHLRDAKTYLPNIMKLLKPGGMFYSTFGPVWYGPSGDHLSGYDSLRNIYAHLEKDPDDYKKYVDAYRPPGQINRVEDDPRLWVEHDLFSRLAVDQYTDILLNDCALDAKFIVYTVEPRVAAFKKQYPEVYERVKAKTGKTSEDLDLENISFIGQKRR